MELPIVYHATLSANTAYTFNLKEKPTCFLIKNLTTGIMSISYGISIDTDSYILLPAKTAEIISVSNVDNEESKTDKVTVSSEGTGTVEIRLLDY